MKNKNLSQSKHIELLQLFHTEFEKVYRHMVPASKKELLALVPTLFKKWYFSSLIKETVLTPGNIVSFDLKKKTTPQTVYAYNLRVDKKQKGNTKYHYELTAYSVWDHPILKDLQILIDYCTPAAAMDGYGFFLPEEKQILLDSISQQDIFYLDYLTSLAWELNLLKNIPSLHSQKIQSTSESTAFFEQDSKEALLQVVDAALSLTAQNFNAHMHLDQDILTKDTFRPYLNSQQDIDHIFINLYQYVDIHIEDIWDKASSNDLTDEESSILSSLFFLSILLDKWFLTPFASYFHIIQPLHSTPFRFLRTVNNLATMLIMKTDVSMEIFVPCSYYHLSPIGDALFPDGLSKKNMQTIPSKLSFEDVMEAVSNHFTLQLVDETLQIHLEPEPVYTFKVKFSKNKHHWKKIEVLANNSLSEFCGDICAAFGFEEIDDYTLIGKDHNDYPIRYSPKHSKKAVNKAENFTLAELKLMDKDKLTFIPTMDRRDALEFEVINIGTTNPYVTYPRVIRQSKMLTESDPLDTVF